MAISKNGSVRKAAKKVGAAKTAQEAANGKRGTRNGGKVSKMAQMPEIRVDEKRRVIEIPYNLESEVMSESGKSAIIGGSREYPFDNFELDTGEIIGVKCMVILRLDSPEVQ